MSKLNYKNIFNKELESAGSSGSADAAPRMTEKCEHSAPACHPWTSVSEIPAFAGMTEQIGRSMVEMLGVLAVMGVLSVAGIAGYNNAMNRHRANELLNEVNKRAVVVAAQAMQGRTSYSISEFTHPEGYLFDVYKSNNKQFILTLKTSDQKIIDKNICAQIKLSVGENTPLRSISNDCLNLTFNDDLSISDPLTNTSCTSNNQCDKSETCGEDGFCHGCTDNQTYLNTTSGCVDKPTGCSECKENEYCQISGTNTKLESGVCVPLEDEVAFDQLRREFPLPSGGYLTVWVGPNASWWTAKNWCDAHGKKMVRMASLELSKQQPTPCYNTSCKDIQGKSLSDTYWQSLKNIVGSRFFWLYDTGGVNSAYRIYPSAVNGTVGMITYAERRSGTTTVSVCE